MLTTSSLDYLRHLAVATGPQAYFCNSGNTVKYHASPDYCGLARCGATTMPMSLTSAQQRLDPCKWCY